MAVLLSPLANFRRRMFEAVRFSFLYALREENHKVYTMITVQAGWFKKIEKVKGLLYEDPLLAGYNCYGAFLLLVHIHRSMDVCLIHLIFERGSKLY